MTDTFKRDGATSMADQTAEPVVRLWAVDGEAIIGGYHDRMALAQAVHEHNGAARAYLARCAEVAVLQTDKRIGAIADRTILARAEAAEARCAALVKAAKDLLEVVEAANSTKRGDFFHERRALRKVLGLTALKERT